MTSCAWRFLYQAALGRRLCLTYTAAMVAGRTRFSTFGAGASLCALSAMLAGLPACRRSDPPANTPVTVFVGAGMADALYELADRFQTETGTPVRISAAASGVLRRQLQAGAACDVFISADAFEMDAADRDGLIKPATRRPVAANTLVVVACAPDASAWQDLTPLDDPSTGKIAMGDPAYVPAGRYAKRALEAAGLWPRVQDRLVLADSVRVAAKYVELHQANVGLVYATDAARMADCTVVWQVPADASGEVAFPAAVCARSLSPHAEAFLTFIRSDSAGEVWSRWGFRRPKE